MMLAALVLLAARPATAQLAVGRVEVVMPLGDRSARETAIGVRNESNRAVQALVRLEDWDRAEDGSNRWYSYGTRIGPGSCGQALSIFPQALRLDAGAEQSIRVVLDSAKAPAGECWAAAVVETVQPADRGGQKVTYVVRTAVKIYVQPAGLRADGEIQSVRVVSQPKPGDAPESVEVLFSNTGMRHVVTQGALEIRQADNTVVSRVPLPPVYALPGANHTVRVALPKLPPGHYVFLATMDYGGAEIAAALLEHRAR